MINWGKVKNKETEEEKANKKKIEAELAEVDLLSIRPLRAIATGRGTAEDEQTLLALELSAQNLRKDLKKQK